MKLGLDDRDFKPSVLERNIDFVVSQAVTITIIDAGAYYKEGVSQLHRGALDIVETWNCVQTCVPVRSAPSIKRAFTASYLPVVEVCFRRTKYLGTLR